MTRKLTNQLLLEYCDYAADTEVPVTFSLWGGIAAVASALGRNVFIDQGHYVVYPNMYIVLVAGSGRCRKSTAIGISEKFIHNIRPEVKTFSQKATPQALIASLAGVAIDGHTITTNVSEGIIIADELSTLIGKGAEESGLIPFLTTLWDCKDFTYITKGKGEENICNPCVSLLGGSTIDWIKSAIPMRSIGGGFTSRILFIYQKDHRKLILRTRQSAENKLRAEKISHDLCEIAKLRGPFAIDEPAWKFCEEEYEVFMNESPFNQNRYLAGYANRRHVLLFKVAMVVCASMNDTKLITLQDMVVATRILQDAEKFMPEVLMHIATGEGGIITFEVLEIVKKYKSITRADLLGLMHHKIQAYELDSVIKTLEGAKHIRTVCDGSSTTYKFVKDNTEEVVEEESFTDRILRGNKDG